MPEPRLEVIVARAGIHALTVNGNTSEFYLLTLTEAARMQAEVRALIGKPVGPARPPASWPLLPAAQQRLRALLAD